MEVRELQQVVDDFVRGKGFYAPDSPHVQSPRNLAVSLVLEAAELLEHYQWSEEADTAAVADELADVANYVLQLACLLGIDLEQAVLDKLEQNRGRHW
ncbi:MAG: MazG-like family protein [Anaerolineae bacterium]